MVHFLVTATARVGDRWERVSSALYVVRARDICRDRVNNTQQSARTTVHDTQLATLQLEASE